MTDKIKQVYIQGQLYWVCSAEERQLLDFELGAQPTSVALHQGLDILLAQYLVDNPTKLPSRTTVMEMLVWSHARLNR